MVLLPPLIIKNALPCYIEVIGPVQKNQKIMNYQTLVNDLEAGTTEKIQHLVGDRIEKSEEKSFFLYKPAEIQINAKDSRKKNY